MLACLPACLPACVHACMHDCRHACMDARVHAFMPARLPAGLHAFLSVLLLVCLPKFTFAVLILILPLVTALFMNSLISILHSSSHFAHILSLAVIHSLSLNLWFDSTLTNFLSSPALLIPGITCPLSLSHLDHSQHLNLN